MDFKILMMEEGNDEFNHEDYSPEQYFDDVSGKWLDTKLVIAARKEEMDVFRQHKVYSKVPISQCISETGKRPIGTRWVDVNKGDRVSPKHRSRLIAQELATHKQPELSAAAPPI